MAPKCVPIDEDDVEPPASPTAASDVYSLGMCILEALTGLPLWGTVDNGTVYDRVKNDHLLPQQPKVVDGKVWALIGSMCAYEPNVRLSLDDTVEALNELASQKEKLLVLPCIINS
ncbi:TPA: hypothetical protein N0F65_000189 [Lagenidium giganteum]|uniref:Protein kinase domain-containing protein n=1 Tax=Lagenidium giganteum TaxID=4803 RepID=A0AAV2YTJ2_9STRA|nr:TPA: hypothetical protein N0F65_000189 [Lagenidium giganteum]